MKKINAIYCKSNSNQILFFCFLILTFFISVKLNSQVINDSPCDTMPGGPFDLSEILYHKGSTCGAIGYADDTLVDFPNYYCNKLTEENAVWYKYKFKPGSEGIQIDVLPITKRGKPAIEVFFGNMGFGCGDTLTNFKAGHCDSLPAKFRFGSCSYIGDMALIKIASTEAKCDSFQIKVKEIQRPCNVAEKCSDITSDHKLSPVTSDDLNYVCVGGCMDLACPDNAVPEGCDFSQTPTVWYYVDTDLLAAQLFTTVASNSGTWQPIWSVFWGDCGNLTNAATGNAPPCSNGDNSPDVHQTGADNAVEGYYVAVTYDPNDPPTDGNTEFEICAATIESIIVCLGDINDNCEPDPTVEIKITARENADAEPNVDPDVGYMGPFCPGEEVTVHIEFEYDATDSGADWLIGFCPDFGPGWDMAGYNYDANPPTGTPAGVAEWHEVGDDCAPLAAEHFSFLCTYVDDNGILHICNELCENCSECDQPYLDPLDALPSGWFWLSNGSNATCVAGSCQPHQRWGIGSTQSDVNWDFPLRVKTFDSQEECEQNDDLRITFQTFSDGGAGCWEDPVAECLIDRKQLGPLWTINCDIPPGVIAENYKSEICSGETSNIIFSTEDGSIRKIVVNFEDNPNVTGMKNYIFENGYGKINDTLIINNDSINHPLIIKYFAKDESFDFMCSKDKIDTFQLTVFPEPKLKKQIEIPIINSENIPYNLELQVLNGNTEQCIFEWSDNISGKSGTGNIIPIDGSFKCGNHIFKIKVTDSTGCSSFSEYYANLTLALDTSVSKQNNTLISNLADAQYQWLNCYSGYAKIIGETNQSFTPITNGSYAVEITKEGCMDTSSCHKVIITGIIENTFGDKLKVYPNPTNGKINIEFEDELNDVEIIVSDLKSNEIYRNDWKRMFSTILELDKPAGTYIIQITSGKDHAIVRLVKQR